MKEKYRHPMGEATEHSPDVPEETTADTSEIKEALNIILGTEVPAAKDKKALARPYSLTERAQIFRKKLDAFEGRKEEDHES